MNEFIVNLEHLIPQEEYTIRLQPIFEKYNGVIETVVAEKLNPLSDCKLSLDETNQNEITIHWILPSLLKTKLSDNNNPLVYIIQISHIGRPEKKLEETCFMPGCQDDRSSTTLNFLPQMIYETQRLNCYTTEIPFKQNSSFTIPCKLLPCKVYEISVSILHQYTIMKEFQCKRRFMKNASPAESPKNVYGIALAQNVLFFEMDQPKMPTTYQCGALAYIVSVRTDEKFVNVWRYNYTLITVNDLLINQNSIVHGHQNLSSRLHFLINNPYPAMQHLYVRIQTIPCSERNWIDLRISLPVSNCYLDCVWPNQSPYYQVSQGINVYSGHHISSIITHRLKNSFAFTNCPMIQSTVGSHHPRVCQFSEFSQLSEYAVCRDDSSSVKMCFVPTCDKMAPISCITVEHSIFSNSSVIQIEWKPPELLQSSYLLSNFQSNQLEADSYLIILYRLNEMNKKYRICAQYKFLVISNDIYENWKKYFHDLIIQSLIYSCLGQTIHSFTSTEQNTIAIFENLLPSTQYEISIISFNKFGNAGSEWSEEIATSVAIPCEPEELIIYKIESHAISVKWSLKKSVYCGNPSRVILYYKLVKLNSNNEEWSFIDTEYLLEHIRISSLLPCQTYCVKVRFINVAGNGKLSNIVCNTTKRSAFTNIPVLTSEVIDMDKSVTYGKLGQIMLYLRIEMNYTNYCSILYEFHISIYHDDKNTSVIVSPNSEVYFRKNIQQGLLYQVRGRVRSNESVYSPTLRDEMNMFKFSQWTPLNLVYVNMSHFDVVNFTVTAERPTEIPRQPGGYYYSCSPTITKQIDHSLSQSTYKNSDVKFLNKNLLDKNSYCFDLSWNIIGSLEGLVGFAIQFFLPVEQNSLKSRSLVEDGNHYDFPWVKIARDQSTTEIQQCIQFIWLPCLRCLKNYSIKNAHPRVLKKLEKLINVCQTNKPHHSTQYQISAIHNISVDLSHHINNNYPTEGYNLISNVKELETRLNSLQIDNSNHITLNQTVYRFQYHITPIIDILSSSTSTSSILRKRISRLSSSKISLTPSKLAGNEPKNIGYVILYSVTANDVIYKVTRKWQLNENTLSSSLTGVTSMILIFSSIVLILLLTGFILFIILNRRHANNHKQFIEIQRVDYREDDDAVGYELHEEYKLPIIPLKIPRQPDPIAVHDFVTWFEKNSISRSNTLREEFKLLDIYSYKQEQAKHLTCLIGQRPENRLRNRYRNLLPFDGNYVQLENAITLSESEHTLPLSRSTECLYDEDDDDANNKKVTNDKIIDALPNIGKEQWITSNYMNASWIPSKIPGISFTLVQSGQLPQKYIAAQAPVDHSCSLFWQMIWDHHVTLIVTLTRCVENGKEKCSMYWPSDDQLSGTKEQSYQSGRTNSIIPCIHAENYDFMIVKHRRMNPGILFICICLNGLTSQLQPPRIYNLSLCLLDRKTNFRWRISSPCTLQCWYRTNWYIYLSGSIMPTINKKNEPVYINLDSEEEGDGDGNGNGNGYGEEGDEAHQSEASKIDEQCEIKNLVNGSKNKDQMNQDKDISNHDFLLNGTLNTELKSIDEQYHNYNNDYRIKRRRFIFSRRRTHSTINIFKAVLWLRCQRSRMVQTTEQYIFIYECLAYFIKQLKRQDGTYENI
ncbi:unnamed protein product [Heterobilharzia americana]|nr:unnamed protein product [Heterobilharzia americana]